MNTTISSIKKKKIYNNEYKTWPVLEMLLTASISLNMTGKPREHKSSMMFTENASKTTPSKASIKDFSLTILLIDFIIFFLPLESTTSQPSSFWLNTDDVNLTIWYTPRTIAIAEIATLI